MHRSISTHKHQILIVKGLLHLLLPHLLQETLSIGRRLGLHLSRNSRLGSSRPALRHYFLLPGRRHESWLLEGVFFEEVVRGVLVELVRDLLVAVVVVIEVEDEGEGEAVVDLVAREGFVVEVEALKHQVKQFGQAYELDSSLRQYLLLAGTAVIQIVLVQEFRLDVALEAEL